MEDIEKTEGVSDAEEAGEATDCSADNEAEKND